MFFSCYFYASKSLSPGKFNSCDMSTRGSALKMLMLFILGCFLSRLKFKSRRFDRASWHFWRVTGQSCVAFAKSKLGLRAEGRRGEVARSRGGQEEVTNVAANFSCLFAFNSLFVSLESIEKIFLTMCNFQWSQIPEMQFLLLDEFRRCVALSQRKSEFEIRHRIRKKRKLLKKREERERKRETKSLILSYWMVDINQNGDSIKMEFLLNIEYDL